MGGVPGLEDFTRLGPDGANLIIREGPAVETTDVGEAA